MHADDLVINHGTTGQAIERVAKLLPHFDRKTATALVIKSVDAVDPSAFVISTQKEKVLRVLDFVSEQKTHHFQ